MADAAEDDVDVLFTSYEEDIKEEIENRGDCGRLLKLFAKSIQLLRTHISGDAGPSLSE
jgi:hypothetical protein